MEGTADNYLHFSFYHFFFLSFAQQLFVRLLMNNMNGREILRREIFAIHYMTGYLKKKKKKDSILDTAFIEASNKYLVNQQLKLIWVFSNFGYFAILFLSLISDNFTFLFAFCQKTQNIESENWEKQEIYQMSNISYNIACNIIFAEACVDQRKVSFCYDFLKKIITS